MQRSRRIQNQKCEEMVARRDVENNTMMSTSVARERESKRKRARDRDICQTRESESVRERGMEQAHPGLQDRQTSVPSTPGTGSRRCIRASVA